MKEALGISFRQVAERINHQARNHPVDELIEAALRVAAAAGKLEAVREFERAADEYDGQGDFFSFLRKRLGLDE
jgi:hypothetical protein